MALTKNEIKTVQRWLKKLLGLPSLQVTGTVDTATSNAIKDFKTAVGITPVDDDLEDLSTWSTLCDAAAWMLLDDDVPSDKPLFTWMRLTAGDRFAGVNNARFLNLVSDHDAAYTMTDEAKRGLILFLHYLESDPDITDIRWAAYMLATVKGETTVFQPIEENPKLWKKHDPGYASLKSFTDHEGNTASHRYYGRGYVQITKIKNYQDMSDHLFGDDRLPAHPELCLEHDTAYPIISFGMRNGTFSGVGMGKFITDTATDYVSARNVVNGTDRAAEFAGYATEFEGWLRARGFQFRGPALDWHVRKHEVEVSTVQRWLKDLLLLPSLQVTGKFDAATRDAVVKFQHAVDNRPFVETNNAWRYLLRDTLGELYPVTGIIDMGTWLTLADAAAWLLWNRDKTVSGHPPVYAWERLTADDLFADLMLQSYSNIVARYETTFQRTLDDASKRGLLFLFLYAAHDPAVTDVRLQAYLLATVKHDTAGTFWPVKRKVAGQGKFFFRGYVQLTGEENYHAASQGVFADDRLVTEPEQLLQPDVAYQVMSWVMLHGELTPQKGTKRKPKPPRLGPKLGDFINDRGADYVKARDVVKKGDKAAPTIATWAKAFEGWLRRSP